MLLWMWMIVTRFTPLPRLITLVQYFEDVEDTGSMMLVWCLRLRVDRGQAGLRKTAVTAWRFCHVTRFG